MSTLIDLHVSMLLHCFQQKLWYHAHKCYDIGYVNILVDLEATRSRYYFHEFTIVLKDSSSRYNLCFSFWMRLILKFNRPLYFCITSIHIYCKGPYSSYTAPQNLSFMHCMAFCMILGRWYPCKKKNAVVHKLLPQFCADGLSHNNTFRLIWNPTEAFIFSKRNTFQLLFTLISKNTINSIYFCLLCSLRLFQKFDTFRILVCGGDGSVGWVLSEIDSLSLHKQVPFQRVFFGMDNPQQRGLLLYGIQCGLN